MVRAVTLYDSWVTTARLLDMSSPGRPRRAVRCAAKGVLSNPGSLSTASALGSGCLFSPASRLDLAVPSHSGRARPYDRWSQQGQVRR